MPRTIRRKLFSSVLKLVFPAILIVLFALVAGAIWLVHRASAQPPRAAYLVTPERLQQFTQNNRSITDETWSNRDNTTARGWLVRGAQNQPAVVLLHRYGADRSWLLNLSVQLNEATNFTVLIPDLRGHGERPAIKESSFGGCEADDLANAIEFLNNLKTEKTGEKLTNGKIGVYGVETGALAAAFGAANSAAVAALALDSVPASSGAVIESVVNSRASFVSIAATPLAQSAAPLYFARGCYKNSPICEAAQSLQNRKILLLAGNDAAEWQNSTRDFASCLNNPANVHQKLDLPNSGYNIAAATNGAQQAAYNKIVIEFFSDALNK